MTHSAHRPTFAVFAHGSVPNANVASGDRTAPDRTPLKTAHVSKRMDPN